MSTIRLSSRYAKSLIDLAIERDQLDDVLADVKGILKSIKQSKELAQLLKSPIIHAGKKHTILQLLFKNKVSAMTMAFIDILVRKGREPYLADIAEAFLTQYNKYKHITRVKLTTAIASDDKMVDAIMAEVKKAVNLEKVELETAVDPELIGGFVLEFDNQLYDTSIARQLELLEKEFSNNAFMKGF